MRRKENGKNRGIWHGELFREFEFSHSIKKGGEIIEEFFQGTILVKKEEKKQRIDSSKLPVLVSRSRLEKLGRLPSKGDVLFIKGPWRVYDNKNKQTGKTKSEQFILAKGIELHEKYTVSTRNKLELEGVLVKKLFKFKRKEDGTPIRDEGGKLVPRLDDENKLIHTTRENKEGKVVNDFFVAINREIYKKDEDGRIITKNEKPIVQKKETDYVPCIAYFDLAKQVAYEIDIGERVVVEGYAREREIYNYGKQKKVYEIVIEKIETKTIKHQ